METFGSIAVCLFLFFCMLCGGVMGAIGGIGVLVLMFILFVSPQLGFFCLLVVLLSYNLGE